jgi:tRNA(Arg) A34 adenosine deaminase TadA
MARAIELAIDNVRNGRGGPFAAIIVRDLKVVAEGVNRVVATNDPTAHAEIVAIREACRALGSFQLDGCDIYTTCEPCPMCLGAIYWARPRRVFFGAGHSDAAEAGFDDTVIYDEIDLPLESRKIPFIPLMREEALAVFGAWEKNPNRIRY